jgi:predicted RNA-binding Zn-ribbon protein involved in translation (DUF1610 family)
MKHEAGTCPKCGHDELEYIETNTDCEWQTISYTCPECEHEGVEVYSLIFIEHKPQ